jgi:GT2 family glycosyltransferase
MTIAVFAVNYRADAHLIRFVDSVAVAKADAHGTDVSLHVIDNSCKTPSELSELREHLRRDDLQVTLHSSGRNEGYFGGLSFAQSLVTTDTSCVIYCNPDILLERDFFAQMQVLDLSGTGVVAPAIVTLDEGFDQNPFYVDRLSRAKLIRLRAIYSTQATYAAFTLLARVSEMMGRRGRRNRQVEGAREIYAPHGAIFVFTSVPFFMALPKYPCFLFGEELFVAEEARAAGVSVSYEPSLKVWDIRHASVSALAPSKLRAYLLESVRHILHRYYLGSGGGAR